MYDTFSSGYGLRTTGNIMSLAIRIKKFREKSKKSLQQVADEVGASKAHIWELEIGKSTNPSIKLLTELARSFSVSVADLIGENPAGENENPEIVAMYRDLHLLSETDLETVRIMMERLRRNRSSE